MDKCAMQDLTTKFVKVVPNFFIVGAAKSGTSALANFLGQHPEIFMSPVKEPYFFVHDPEVSESEYHSLFDGANNCKAIGEATTGYLYDASSAQKIKEYIPNAKIIIMLRDPKDMALSLWHYMKANGNETMSFVDAVNDSQRRTSEVFLEVCAGRP